jgi:lipopolysaccharide biosynthesis regulator YciM
MESQLGRDEDSVRTYQQAIAIWKKLANENPAVPFYTAQLQDKYPSLGRYFQRLVFLARKLALNS